MPRGVKRGPVESEAVVVRAGASPAQTTLLDDSPSQPISYHLLDHGYGATPQHQIRREALSAPPKTSEVRYKQYNYFLGPTKHLVKTVKLDQWIVVSTIIMINGYHIV